ncbi:DUF4184 family protein [Actinoplanes couchii]|uniref:DNA mimic protein DMP19 C-terminal domain-containing protein n=1 Tax=Actinoplanes couchii TaxID=403638 RepID=A0ABQ3XPQ6_9ACTN|nr:DUF4184 family protein [Actinoplanes couchii]MDR6319157.1 hypothetical protein [Actinoplanes couchii]GID60497.1 hypothetical protein Aco03nite_089010 [Actinoplanes couchii]
MPFTFSHPAAILPLCRPPFVVSALVAGAVAPDLPYILPAATSADWGVYSDFTLTYTHALIPASIVGLVLLALYHLLLARPLVAMLPAPVAGRLGRPSFRWGGPARTAWIVVSVVLGALTHLVWDALVHDTGPVGAWWWASTVGGALALAGQGYLWWRHTRPAPAPPARWWPLLILAAGGAAGAGLRLSTHALREVVTGAMSGVGASLLLYALAWHALRLAHNDQVTDRDLLRDIWNRACVAEGTGVGDRHLAALILVDGMVQNGGPNHAADSCEPDQLAEAAAAARYFGLDDVAAVIERLPEAASDLDDDDAEDRLSDAWYEVLPDNERLDAALAARHAAAPEDFQPVDGR